MTFDFPAAAMMQEGNEVTLSIEEKELRIQNIISSQTAIHI